MPMDEQQPPVAPGARTKPPRDPGVIDATAIPPTPPPGADPDPTAPADAPRPPRPTLGRAALYLPLIGIAAVAFLAFLGWQAFRDAERANADIQAEISNLQSRVEAVEKRPQPAAVAPAQLAALDKRVGALEQRPAAALDAGAATDAVSAPAQRVDALEVAAGSSKSAPVDLGPLNDKVAALQSALSDAQKTAQGALTAAATRPTPPPPAPPVDLAPLNGRIAAIEQQLATPEIDARALETSVEGGRRTADSAGLAVTADAMLQAIAAGAPFRAELAAAAALGADKAALAPLEPAVAGVPTSAALAVSFAQAEPAILAAAAPPAAASGSLLDRLAAGASTLVKVRPVGAVAGDDPPALVSQIREALTRGAPDAALALWNRLPEPCKAASRAWAASAQARVSAQTAARRLLDAAIDDLGRGGKNP
jgi:hypothetical protein